jgi:chloramphenicol 3-O-phosphotransferase
VSAGEKNTADAHDEMDGSCYGEYFVQQYLASLPSQSVMAVDSAVYYSRTKSKRKENMLEWLRTHPIPFEEEMLKGFRRSCE